MTDDSQQPRATTEHESGDEPTVDLSQLPELVARLRADGEQAPPADPALRETVTARLDQAAVPWPSPVSPAIRTGGAPVPSTPASGPVTWQAPAQSAGRPE
jgi:hypothetical protein